MKFLSSRVLLWTLLSFMLFSCDNDDLTHSSTKSANIDLNAVKKAYKDQFKLKLFKNLKKEPLWNEAATINYNGEVYLEIPYRIIGEEDLINSTSVSFDKLIASKDELKIVHFYAQDIDANFDAYNELGLDNLQRLNGFLTIFNLDKEVIDLKRYLRGKESFKKYSLLDSYGNVKHMNEDEENCENVTENIYTRICSYWMDQDGNPIELIMCTPWEVSESYTYLSCEGENSNTSTESNITEEELVQVLDSLTGRSKCVYDKLKSKNNNLFKSTIGKFIGDTNYNLILKNGNCTNSNTACTDGGLVSSGVVSIIIEDNYLSPLDMAATLLHEGIHAEIFRYVDRFQKGLDPNNRAELFRLYKYYTGLDAQWGTSNAQHQYMMLNYVTPIAKSIRALDNNNYPLEYYMAYGWDGLEKFGYHGTLTTIQMSEYNQKRATVNQNTNFNDCQ